MWPISKTKNKSKEKHSTAIFFMLIKRGNLVSHGKQKLKIVPTVTTASFLVFEEIALSLIKWQEKQNQLMIHSLINIRL